jgi:hypothetical protein
MLKSAGLYVFFVLAFFKVNAQNDVLNTRISLKLKKQSMVEILNAIEIKAGVTFNYNSKIIPNGLYSINAKDEELSNVLVQLLNPHKLGFSLLYGKNIVISKQAKKISRYTISGYVNDEVTGEKLIGASIHSRKGTETCLSNQDGFYSLTMVSDSIQLVFEMPGYQNKTMGFKLVDDLVLNVQLKDEIAELRYTVSSKIDERTSYKPDEFHFNGKTLKQLPVLFGESDVMKGLQLLPGVSSGNDGTIGLNIRGGGPDQNLILLDDVPIYNPSHIYGFFSVFNSDVVKDVKLLKGGMNARYNGRLSSVIDVRTIDGNSKKLKLQASLGLLSSKITVDGPIFKNGKTTFLLAGRRSYLDLLSNVAQQVWTPNTNSPLRTSYYFYDANGKIKHSFSQKHQLSFSFYTGQDNTFIKNSFSAKDPGKIVSERDKQAVFWGNKVFSLRDHHVLNPKLSAWVNASYSSYDFGNESSYEYNELTDSSRTFNAYNYRFISSINNSILSYNLEYKPTSTLTVKAGLGMVYHVFQRDVFTSDSIIQKELVNTNQYYAMEYNSYVDAAWLIRRNIRFNAGVNYVQYHIRGDKFNFAQPRLSFNYKPVKNLLLHAAFQRTAQFLHLLTSNTIGIPIDMWLPSTNIAKPETANTYSGGISYYKGDYAFNVEAFHKEMSNVIDYKEQANYIGSDNNWEDKITLGKGRSYGYEFLAEKRSGKTKGWVSYTLSWNFRQFDKINGGKEFPYKYDRRHNLAVLISHAFTPRIDASLTWVYTSGANYTLPEQVYFVNSGLQKGNAIYVYGDRNNYQFPDYHRLDFALNFKKFKKHYTRILSVGVYNAYNRQNPFYINLAYNSEGKRVFEAVSLFPVLPSINYKIVF